MQEIELPKNLKWCRNNPFKSEMSLKDYESILLSIFGVEHLTKTNYTEKYTNIKLVLFYYKGAHIGTYNKKTKTTASFYE
jgi:hypothetical protein